MLEFHEGLGGCTGRGHVLGEGNGLDKAIAEISDLGTVRAGGMCPGREWREGVVVGRAGLVLKSPVCYGKEFKLSPGGKEKLLKRLSWNVTCQGFYFRKSLWLLLEDGRED